MVNLENDELLLADPIRLQWLGHQLAHPVQRKQVEAVVTTPGTIAIVAGQSAAYHLTSTRRPAGGQSSIPQFLTEHNSAGHLVLSRRCQEKIRGKNVLVVGDHLVTETLIKEARDAVARLGAVVVGISILSARSLDDADFYAPGCTITIINPGLSPDSTA